MRFRRRTDRTLDSLWAAADRSSARFDPASIDDLPPTAQRYLARALAPGAPMASAVRLSMTGSIRLEPGWCDFTAEQVIEWNRGFVWAARARVRGLPVSGFDRFVDGRGAMRWKLGGLWPLVRADGPDIDRAAAGRFHAESIWLPSVLLGPEVRWSDRGPTRTLAEIDAHGELSKLVLDVDEDGLLVSCFLDRWGNPDGPFAYHPFGGTASEERTFDGVTVPTRHRVGWFFDTPRFDDGEFFRCTITNAQYR